MASVKDFIIGFLVAYVIFDVLLDYNKGQLNTFRALTMLGKDNNINIIFAISVACGLLAFFIVK